MPRHLLIVTLVSVSVWTGFLVPPANSQTDAIKTWTQEVNGFTRSDYIPVGANINSLRFENLRLVQVPTMIKHTVNGSCGSIGCERVESRATAYEVTFSYEGQPMASEEQRGSVRYFTMHVYFRPDQLDQSVRRAASAPHQNRDEIAGYFALSITPVQTQTTVIDQSRSRFCDRQLVSGKWVQIDPVCRQRIVYKSVGVPSDYLMVRVDPTTIPH